MTPVRATSRTTQRRGTVLVWVALSLSTLFGILALNMDGGRMMEERRRVQAVADAAALAAGADLYAGYWTNRGSDPSGTAKAAAEQVAAAHGYPASAVTVSIPPQSGTFSGQAGHAEVVLKTTLDTGFGRVFTGDGLVVSARSVCRGEPLKIGIHALRANGADAFMNNSLALAVLNKPIIVNSNDPAAYHQASFGAAVASRIDVTGGYSNTGGAITLARVRTNVKPTLDPLAFLPVPTSGTVRSTTPTTINTLIPLAVTLQPGVYKGGIRITGLSVVTMTPGVYIMEGGGFQVDGLASVVGLGTMVYNTTSTAYPPGPISVTGVGKVVMVAPLSGTYQGISFFQNRSMTQQFDLTALGLTTVTGTVYAASAKANLSGSVAAEVDIRGGAYVVDTIAIGGVGAVTINLDLSLDISVDLGVLKVGITLRPNRPRVPDVRVVE